MQKTLLLLAAALVAPQAAHAAASATTGLSSGNVVISFAGAAAPTGIGEVFSRDSASFNFNGVTRSDNSPIPGTADAAAVVDGPISADSIIIVTNTGGSFETDASGTVDGSDFGSAGGNVTGSFEFASLAPGLVITIVVDYTRFFDLTAGAQDTAVGRTALSFGVRNSEDLVPTITLSNPDCNPNVTFSVADGTSFADSCSGTATFAFAALPAGNFTLSFGAASNIDVVAKQVAVPAPAALAVFGFGLVALGFGRRR